MNIDISMQVRFTAKMTIDIHSIQTNYFNHFYNIQIIQIIYV